jgi:hypothetical protein
MKIIDEVLCLKVEWVTQKVFQISPRKFRFEWSLRGRDFSTKESVSKSMQAKLSGQTAREGGGPFIALQGNCPLDVSETRTCLG